MKIKHFRAIKEAIHTLFLKLMMNTTSSEQTYSDWSEDTLKSNETMYPSISNGSLLQDGSDFAEAFDSPTIKALTLIIYFVVILIGCPLHFLVIHYEQFGGDPQKRSIFNQIITYISATEILYALVFEHIFLARVLFGCLPKEIGTLNWFCINFRNSVFATFITIIVTYRAMRIFSFRRIAGLNDNAVSIFILLATAMNNFLYTIILYMLGAAEAHPAFKIVACRPGGENIDLNQT